MFGFGQKNSIIGLDIGTYEVKGVEMVRSGDSYYINAFATCRIHDESDPNDVKYAIKEVLRRGRFRSKRVASSISGRSVIVRYVNMFHMSEEDLRSSIHLEADKYIPFDVDEVIIDCQILGPAEDEDKMKVLLVAAKKEDVKKRVDLLKEVGLQPVVIDVDAFALGNAFELRQSSLSPLAEEEVEEEEERVVALIDIGAFKTSINILVGNVSSFTREVYLAGRDFTEAIAKRLGVDTEEAERLKCDPGDQIAEIEDAVLPSLDDLGNEIHLSFDFFETNFEREVREIYISGGSSRLPGLERTFEGIFERKVSFWDPVEAVQVHASVDQNVIREVAPQLPIAIGLATRMDG